jgi:hypothetical protein
VKGARDSHVLRHWEALLVRTDPGPAADSWTVDGVAWSRQRHTYWGLAHSFRIEAHTLVRSDARPWRLLVVKETHWGSDRSQAARAMCWCQLESGRSEDLTTWMRAVLGPG